MNEILSMNRRIVNNDYESAGMINKENHLAGHVKYGAEYIYKNQKEDAQNIVNLFYKTDVRAVSVLKRTKLGMDGLMIEISKLFATHPDDNFALHRDNIFIITGMSNILWEREMVEKIPNCFKKNVYHHGKLEKLKKNLQNVKNALFIIDEIDTGDKRHQRLHTILQEGGFLDLNFMKNNNIRFIFVSATSINQIQELSKWGSNHAIYSMTIPDTYIGHGDFLEKGIIQEYYLINCVESSKKWVKTDIIDNYGTDYRIHIIRTDDTNKGFLQTACIEYGVDYKNHSCEERIDSDELDKIFASTLEKHMVIAIKGLYRRANYIPNEWKLKIGATHERYTTKCDTSVQIQGLPGRMTGYWRNEIINGHKTGPYRTSINAIEEYELFYKNPTDDSITYSTQKTDTFVSSHYIKNLIQSSDSSMDRVPVTIQYFDNKIIGMKKRGEILDYIKVLLHDKPEHKMLLEFVSNKNNKCLKIFRPKNDKQRKTYITDVEEAIIKNIPYNVELPDCMKTQNNWQMFIDDVSSKLHFIVCCHDNSYE
jgi:hypothetical protein